MSNVYLERYAYQKSFIKVSEYTNPSLIVVLPCHNEIGLIDSLESIVQSKTNQYEVAVIVVINASEADDAEIKSQNQLTLAACQEWYESLTKSVIFHFILDNELPKKHAGVGLARKIGMDEAVRIFEYNSTDGVIVCFDADSTCQANLLFEIGDFFKKHSAIPGCSIHFEHPLEGHLIPEVYEGIISYELHLRYYIDALKYARFPYAFQTIGSSMAVRSSAYQKQGGMNRRKAGEDFYFLHKIIPLGNFKDLNTTTIYPSPRRSDRVPFGTGRAMGTWLDESMSELLTYNPLIFQDLKECFRDVDRLYNLDIASIDMAWKAMPESFQAFVSLVEFEAKTREFIKHSTSSKIFVKRFFQWFDGFKVLKFVHHSRDAFYPNVSIGDAVDWLFEVNTIHAKSGLKDKLIALRIWDKSDS